MPLTDELLLTILNFIIKEGKLVTREELDAAIQNLLDSITTEIDEVNTAIQELKEALAVANAPDFTSEFAKLTEAVNKVSKIVTPVEPV